MISEELKAIIDKFKEQGKMNFLEETTEEKILSFEKEKGVTLPSKYKEWLLFSDGGELFLPAGVQFYGIENKPLIDVNDNSRPSDDYVVIGALASGDPILFEKNSEKIAIYNQAAGRIEEDEIYDDFIAFLTDLYDLLEIAGLAIGGVAKAVSSIKGRGSGSTHSTPSTSANSSVAEKVADIVEIQKDKKGNIIYDKDSKDIELVAYEEDIQDYMDREVIPYVPDAKAFFEENLGAKKPVIKTGAEIPFTRTFYKYQAPQSSVELADKFVELERMVSESIEKLFG